MSRIPEKVESILFTYPKIFNYYIIVSINQYPTLLHRITQGWIVYEKKIYIYISVSSIHSRLAARFRLRNDIGFPRFLSLLLPDYFLRVTVPWPWVTARWWISLPPRVCESSRDSFGGFCNVEWAGRYSWAAVLLSEQHVACTNTFRAPCFLL